MNDDELLGQFVKEQNEDAFRKIVERYSNMVYGVCCKMLGNADMAEEASQAVFITLARKAESIRKHALSMWLFRTSSLVVSNMKRKEARRKKHEREAAKIELAEQNELDQECEKEKMAIHLNELISSIGRKYQYAVTGHFLGGKSKKELALELGCSEGALGKRISRALEKMRKILRKKGITVSIVTLTGFLAQNVVEASPAGLVHSCHAAAMAGSAGSTAAFSEAALLSKGVIRMMFWAKIKIMATVLLAVCAISAPIVIDQIEGQEPKVPSEKTNKISSEKKELPYRNDPKIIEILKNLEPGNALRLPKVKILVDGKPAKNLFRGGPYSRDYTNKMAYAPDRQTALYCGGNHGSGRTNDVWEYHLGSNTWYCLQPPVGGDHAKHKNMLMFMPRKWKKTPDYKMNDKEKKEFEAAKAWWNKYVILKDGHYVTKKNEATLLHGHTWDTLVYDPIAGMLIQGTGAHCAGNPLLHHKFTGMPLDEVKSKLGKNSKGIPYKTMWMFDPVKKQWNHYASNDKLARLRGMGATMCYIPDWKKTLFYVAAQNVSPNAMEMNTYDAANDKWEALKPNNGTNIRTLAYVSKIAPGSEVQTAYSSKHKKMVAVLKNDVFAYDIVKNEWSKVCTDARIYAHDAKTIFAYDSAGDVFILAGPRQKVKFALFDLKTGKWEIVTPPGSKMPRAPWSEGKGYYDPVHNVFVLHNSKGLWVYRHKK